MALSARRSAIAASPESRGTQAGSDRVGADTQPSRLVIQAAVLFCYGFPPEARVVVAVDVVFGVGGTVAPAAAAVAVGVVCVGDVVGAAALSGRGVGVGRVDVEVDGDGLAQLPAAALAAAAAAASRDAADAAAFVEPVAGADDFGEQLGEVHFDVQFEEVDEGGNWR
ncbi:hypothetical protein PG991_013318 [Apiospora marii]|uniref:Uncharacterized protein n=1 Tax=Apiospora marii TaxID=335849 RepID=A0ABR1R6D8_9PEZI